MNSFADRRAVVLVVALSSFLTPFAASSFNIALPSIGREFSLDAISMSWASLAYLLSSAMFLVPFGRLADIYGRKRVFVYGMATLTVASVALAASPSSLLLIPLRALQGFGTSMVFGTSVAILMSVFSDRDKGAVLGINVASVYIGLSVGPFLGGLLTQSLGWRSIFLVSAGLGLTAMALALWGLRGEWIEAEGESFDIFGSTLFSLMLLSLMYGFSLLPSQESILPIAFGAIGLAAFIIWETRQKSPVLDLDLFRGNRGFAFSNLAALINYSATYALTFFLSLYLQYIRGFGPEQAGLLLMPQPIVQALFSPAAGRLSDRMEPRIVSSAGMSVTTIGLLSLTVLSEETPETIIVGSLVLLGFGLALFSSPNTNAIMSSVDRRLYGLASATLGTMRLTGQMLSMGIAMMIVSIYVGRVEITPPTYPLLMTGIRTAFVAFSALCFIGILASLVKSRPPMKSTEN